MSTSKFPLKTSTPSSGVCSSQDCCGDQIAQDVVALEEEEEDPKVADNYSLWVGPLQLSKPDITSMRLMLVIVLNTCEPDV